MPTAILDPNRNTIKSPLARSILNEVSLNPVSTSIIGPKLVDPEILKNMKRLALEIPGNVKEQATNRIKAMVHRLLSEADQYGASSAKVKGEYMNRIASDPVANVIMQSDIVTQPIPGKNGFYQPAFWNPSSAENRVEEVLQASKRGTDAVQEALRRSREFSQGSPHAMFIDEAMVKKGSKGLGEVLAHEANHGSQDRFGVFLDPVVDNQYKQGWAGNPIEWESMYAEKIGDPSQSKSIADVLALGQNKAMAHTGDSSLMFDDTYPQLLSQLNHRILRSGTGKEPLLDAYRIFSSSGGPWTNIVNQDPRQFHNPTLNTLMQAILGQK